MSIQSPEHSPNDHPYTTYSESLSRPTEDPTRDLLIAYSVPPNTAPSLQDDPADGKRGLFSKVPPTVWIVGGVLLLLVLIIGTVILAFWLAQTQAPTIAAIRDILIIVLALESCLFGIIVMLLLVMVIRLVNMLEFEIKPILEKTNETISTLRGTTDFVSKNIVRPTIRARAHAAGVRQALKTFKTLFGNPRNNIK